MESADPTAEPIPLMTLRSFAARTRRRLRVLLEEARHARLPGPWWDLHWETTAPGPAPRVEAAFAQFGSRLFVIGGYQTLDNALSRIDVLDLDSGQWLDTFPLPQTIAQTHSGVVGDGTTHIYFISGQLGPQCSPATPTCAALDTRERSWHPLPPLPSPRYAPVTRLWQGRLHVIGGTGPDRATAAAEHWSLAIENGRATESVWREEPPIPVPGPHRASAAIGDTLYVLGTQNGDRPPRRDDPTFTCDWNSPDEIITGECFALRHGSDHWERIADMPVPVTHAEFSTFVSGDHIVVIGGMIRAMTLTDLIQIYDTRTGRWEVAGRLPRRNKGSVIGLHDGWLHVISGQEDLGRYNPRVGAVIAHGYRTRLPLA